MTTPRRHAALLILRDPASYMVCEGCSSIYQRGGSIDRITGICPACHAFRFDRSPARVIATARTLASRDRRSPTADDYR